jgi:glutamate 5-kinase
MRIVIKFGTSTLTADTPRLNKRRMLHVAQQITRIIEQGVEVVVVSSGAMAAGREQLGITPSQKPKKPSAQMPFKQMLAAVGQTHLMLAWEQVFGMFEKRVAQVLLTREDLHDRHRYLNARNTLEEILQHGIVPIINENDAVATEEIRVGDNDNLSALVANVVDADLLLILTDQQGLFTADPRKDPHAKLIEQVTRIDDDLRAIAGASKSGLGVGGMTTKLQAAELAMRSGITTVLAHGARDNVISDVANGARVGTKFLPSASHVESRKRWILSESVRGEIIVDAGAARALLSGKSLLPVGAREVVGDFKSGEVVAVRNLSGGELARGIVRFSSIDARRVIGKKTDEITTLLQDAASSELIHADDLIVVAAEK